MTRAPVLPESFTGEGWRQVRTQTKAELTLPVFSIRSHSRLYEHSATADRLRPVSGADLEMPPRAVFTTTLEFEPSIADLGVDPASTTVFGVARRRAGTEFARSVREDGLVSVERTDARWLDRDDGTEARAFRYDAAFPLTPRALSGGPREPTLRGVLWAAIWPTEAAYAMAGGIYPAETLNEALDRQGATLREDVVTASDGDESGPDDGRRDNREGSGRVAVDVDRERDRRVLARAIRGARIDA